MKCITVFLALLLLAGTAWGHAPADGAAPTQSSMIVKGKITIAPDGTVGGYSLDQPGKLPQVVVALLGRSIPHWRFDPVRADGKPVTVKATMYVRMLATQVDATHYAVSVGDTTFDNDAAKSTQRESPVYAEKPMHPGYPMDAALHGISGTVYVAARIDHQGNVARIAVLHVDLLQRSGPNEMAHWRKVLAASATDAIRGWRFDVPNVGKAAKAPYWDVMIPVVFSTHRTSNASAYGKWQPYLPGPHLHVSWMSPEEQSYGSTPLDGDTRPLKKGLHRINKPHA